MTKVVLITGSTDGIGKLTAIQFAKAGDQVYLHGRSAEKLQSVLSEVKKLSGNEQVEGFVADFANLEAVEGMVEQVRAKLSKIDVLINNAGIFKSANVLNNKGVDLRFAVNYFAPYVLTNGLLPLLEQSKQARIVNLSSAAQLPIVYEALHGKIELPMMESYAQSKLAITMWSFHLASQLNNTVVIAVNPGSLLNTKMVQEGFGYHKSSADKGANILYELASNKRYAGDSGKYFDNDQGDFGLAQESAYNKKEIDRLMDETAQVLYENKV